jgi:hypothetical protein
MHIPVVLAIYTAQASGNNCGLSREDHIRRANPDLGRRSRRWFSSKRTKETCDTNRPAHSVLALFHFTLDAICLVRYGGVSMSVWSVTDLELNVSIARARICRLSEVYVFGGVCIYVRSVIDLWLRVAIIRLRGLF